MSVTESSSPREGIPHFPKSPRNLDYITVSIISAGGFLMLLGTLVLFHHRAYRPIKAKSFPLTLFSSIAGLMWVLSSLIVNNHFARSRHSGLDLCILWTFWIQACFGYSLWLNCFTVRFITLYRIFILKSVTRIHEFVFILPLSLPFIIFAIAATIKNKSVLKFETMAGDPNKGHCVFVSKPIWVFGVVLLQFINYLILMGFGFRLRNTMAQFNEFRLIRRCGVLSIFLFLLSFVTLQTDVYNKSTGRCFLSVAAAGVVFYAFWGRNGVVIYNVIFHREAYLEKFNDELRRLPSDLERTQSSGAFSKMETQLNKVRREAQEYEQKIKELEEEVNALEVQCDALEHKPSTLG